VLKGRGQRHHKLRPFVVGTDFDDAGQRVRRKRAQPGHKPLVFRRLAALQHMHGDIAPEAALTGAEALRTFPGQRLDQLVFRTNVHSPSASF
jgi:hypothetical protein